MEKSFIPRHVLDQLKAAVMPGKVVVIFGPRRVGKTTILKKFLNTESNYLFVTGEDIFVRDFLSSGSVEKLKEFVGEKSLLVIDEAQYVPDIGLNLKLIVDHIPHLKVIATGSSTFDLTKQIGEPLTGRKHVIKMFSIAQLEMKNLENLAETKGLLESRLIYGSYPEVITFHDDALRQEYLHDLVSSYLIKDILAFEGIQKSKKLIDLLILLAFQIGKEVSHSELATQLSISKTTIDKYLDLLEQVFVIFNVRGFSRNLRKEVTKSSRYYFYDTGIRNALINNFNRLHRRDDVGALWENYLASERIKKQHYQRLWSHNFFWRTYDQKEIDWVEEREGKLFGYDFKWGDVKAKPPKLWQSTYPEASFQCINAKNYLDFIT
ncbi:MAG TPA: ATP-binding protein [Rhabdochlamydiaceae bacterium]|nr:ATP-binding protein [Rhabdochlamydiaceae bacterium]